MRDIYLDDILPSLDIDYERYWESERNVINPALNEAGYFLNARWRTGDGDSFGPLSRFVYAEKDDGEEVRIIYG